MRNVLLAGVPLNCCWIMQVMHTYMSLTIYMEAICKQEPGTNDAPLGRSL